MYLRHRNRSPRNQMLSLGRLHPREGLKKAGLMAAGVLERIYSGDARAL